MGRDNTTGEITCAYCGATQEHVVHALWGYCCDTRVPHEHHVFVSSTPFRGIHQSLQSCYDLLTGAIATAESAEDTNFAIDITKARDTVRQLMHYSQLAAHQTGEPL